jgi:hypothetical protein
MKKATLVILGLALLLPMAAMAQVTSDPTLAITATLQSTMQVQIVSATSNPVTFGGTTAAATLALGNVSAFGAESLPTNVTQVTTPGTNFVLTIPFAVVGYGANVTQTGFTYVSTRTKAGSDGNTWAIGGTTVPASGGTASSHVLWNATTNYSLTITVPTSTAAGAIGDTITFTATAS